MDFSSSKTNIFKLIIVSKFGISSFSQIEKFVKLHEGQTLDSIFTNDLDHKLYEIISEKYGEIKASEIKLEVKQQLNNLTYGVVLDANTIQVSDSLGDVLCRVILDHMTKPLEESDIVKITKIAKTTVHRKIKQLLDSGLIEESTGMIKRNGKYVIRFKKSFHTINVRYTSTKTIEIVRQ